MRDKKETLIRQLKGNVDGRNGKSMTISEKKNE